MAQKLRFIDNQQSDFFTLTRNRVDAYFKENGLSKHANAAMWAKAIFFLTGFALLYSLILSNLFGAWAMLGLAALLGMFAAFIGFNVSHDAMHGSFSANGKVNQVLSFSFCILGANPYVWKITHNLVHHTYTNIRGYDEDIELAPGLIRICGQERLHSRHQYQHLYAFGLYGLASLSWVFRKDYQKFFQKKIGQHDNSTHPRIEYVNLFLSKILYYCLFIVLPMLVLNISWWQFLIGFLVMHLAEGWVLGLVFQLAHVVEETSFPVPNQEGNVEECWAIHQMRTTANFARKSALVNFFCGGLNLQVEHHLFPRICHIHYPAIADIVQRTAQECNVPYLENASFFTALRSHYRMLKKTGRQAYREQLMEMEVETTK